MEMHQRKPGMAILIHQSGKLKKRIYRLKNYLRKHKRRTILHSVTDGYTLNIIACFNPNFFAYVVYS